MKIYNKIKPFLSGLAPVVGVVLPARCPVSGSVVDHPGALHPDIWRQIDFIDRPFCVRCGIRFDVPADDDDLCPACLTTPPRYDAARAAVAYDDTSRNLILAFKHGDATHLTTTLTPWIARAAAEFQDTIDWVMPVPLNRWRLLRRRYNQSALLAQNLARLWNKPLVTNVLLRVKATESQGHKTWAERIRNVSGAFRVSPIAKQQIKGKHLLLVDDVYTTGATVNACARILKRSGAAKVYVVTVARVIRPISIEPVAND